MRLDPAERSKSQSIAEIIRERRRRRCKATGEPFEEPPPHSLKSSSVLTMSLSSKCENRGYSNGSSLRNSTTTAKIALVPENAGDVVSGTGVG
jgi:hypothetical protein